MRISSGIQKTIRLALACAALVWGPGAIAAPSAPAKGPADQPGTVFITLGTNAGPIPNPARAEPANYLSYGGEGILIDAGDGAADQLGKAGVPLAAVGTVFISHLHFDHTGGLFAFLGERYQAMNPGTVTIYGPSGIKRTVDALIAAMQPMAEQAGHFTSRNARGPGDNITVIEMAEGHTATVGQVAVTATINSHYILTDPEGRQGLSLSLRFDTPDLSIVYTGDTGPSPAIERLAKDADILVAEIMDPEASLAELKASRPDLPPPAATAIQAHFNQQHLSPTEAGLMAARSGAKSLVLTHNAIGDDLLDKARKAIAEQYQGPVVFAEDLQVFDTTPR